VQRPVWPSLALDLRLPKVGLTHMFASIGGALLRLVAGEVGVGAQLGRRRCPSPQVMFLLRVVVLLVMCTSSCEATAPDTHSVGADLD
jgi:hypothetical protein